MAYFVYGHSMRLKSGGVDIFYIDESFDRNIFVLSAVRIPFLRRDEGTWTFQWHSFFEAAKEWRTNVRAETEIPTYKELHGNKLASGRGRYLRGKHSFGQERGSEAYRTILSLLDFLPEQCIMSVASTRDTNLYGHTRLESSLYGLFQRIGVYCRKNNRNGMVFFDEGHKEYRHLFRRATVYLPTGSMLGGWAGGRLSKNMPLDMFVEAGNQQDSRYSHFIQIADLVAYAATLKIRGEKGLLTDWQAAGNLHTLYECIPQDAINTRASNRRPRDGIVRL